MTSSHVIVPTNTKSMRIRATVTRCGCVTSAARDAHVAAGAPCPVGAKEELGTVAFYHRNPLRRLMWRLFKKDS